jgi:hypothetical protein
VGTDSDVSHLAKKQLENTAVCVDLLDIETSGGTAGVNARRGMITNSAIHTTLGNKKDQDMFRAAWREGNVVHAVKAYRKELRHE